MTDELKNTAAILYTRDLMFSSRVRASASDRGCKLLVADNVAQVGRIAEKNEIPLVMIDLDLIADAVAESVSDLKAVLPDAQFIGYAGHVKEELLGEASATGHVMLMTRGQFNQQHGELLEQFLTR